MQSRNGQADAWDRELSPLNEQVVEQGGALIAEKAPTHQKSVPNLFSYLSPVFHRLEVLCALHCPFMLAFLPFKLLHNGVELLGARITKPGQNHTENASKHKNRKDKSIIKGSKSSNAASSQGPEDISILTCQV